MSPERLKSRFQQIRTSYWSGPLLFAALTGIGAQFEYLIYDIPFTMQTLAVYNAGLFLGAKKGSLSQVIYLAAGLLLPIYAGGTSGLYHLLEESSSGFLLAFPVTAWMVGMVNRRGTHWLRALLSIEVGSLTLFALGISWLYFFVGEWGFWQVLQRGWLLYVPFDQVKILIVLTIYLSFPRQNRKPAVQPSGEMQNS